MDGALFTDWVETQLAPNLAPGTVVILDNLSTHKVAPRHRGPTLRGVLVPLPSALLP